MKDFLPTLFRITTFFVSRGDLVMQAPLLEKNNTENCSSKFGFSIYVGLLE